MSFVVSQLVKPTLCLAQTISTSLVNLMGTASDSITTNNPPPTQTTIITQETRRISTAPAASAVDRLGSMEPLGNCMIESPPSHRTQFSGQSSAYNSKSSGEFSWISESPAVQINNGTSIDECLPQLEIDDKPLIYRQKFEPSEHFNWYGMSETQGPVIISYKYSTDQNKQRSISAIVRIRQRTLVQTLIDLPSSIYPVDILRRLCEQCAIVDVEYFDPVLCDGTHDLLIKYDESHVSTQHKFGIIYQCENQMTEEELFGNETHGAIMEKFLDLIGSRVRLKDFRGFRGGLDVKSDQTGTESIYEQFHGHEIMFHVSTLLPHSKSERQQLERKRHIGNDIVAIVFQETETSFIPEWITSQFLHVYIVITSVDNGNQFKINVIQRDSVPSFGPPLTRSTRFDCDQTFKQWLLTKLINAEMAACRASSIQKYHERTKMSLFDNLYRTLHDNNRPLMELVLYHSQYKHECDIELQQQQKEEMPVCPPKTPDRHTDNSLLGSVRRRFIAPKSRVQTSAPDNGKQVPPTTIIITTPPSNSTNSNDPRSKTRSMTMDLRRSASRESITTNGHTTNNGGSRMTSFFSTSKTSSPHIEKSNTSRSLLEPENGHSSASSRLSTKLLSPATCPSSPWTNEPSNGFTTSSVHDILNGDVYPNSAAFVSRTSFSFNKSSSDDLDNDRDLEFLPDDLQSSSKDELIKFVMTLQHQHNTKLIEIDQIHSTALKRLEMQLMGQQETINTDSS